MTLLISSQSQPDIVVNEVDDEIRGEYGSRNGGGGSIKESAKFKNFKNLKAKNHQMHRRT